MVQKKKKNDDSPTLESGIPTHLYKTPGDLLPGKVKVHRDAQMRTARGNPSLAPAQLQRKKRPRGESPTTQRPPSYLRHQTSHQFTFVTEVIKEWHSHKTSAKGSVN